MTTGRVTEQDIDAIGAADRLWWADWQVFAEGAARFDLAAFEAENDFLECGCGGRDWRCLHFGWRAAILKAAS